MPAPKVPDPICPPSSIIILRLLTVKFPPSPVASGEFTVLYNPLGLIGEVPLISIDSASTLKSPLLPIPTVPDAMYPPSSKTMLRLLTVIFPPFPVASEESTLLSNPLGLPKGEAPLISIDSASTLKSPLLPVPKVPVLICPPSFMVMRSLSTVKFPPFPVASEENTVLYNPLKLPRGPLPTISIDSALRLKSPLLPAP